MIVSTVSCPNLTKVKEVHETIQAFLDHVSQLFDDSRVVFLRYLPAYYSLMVSHTAKIAQQAPTAHPKKHAKWESI